MAIDREATLKNAEKFLRVGRLDAAIAEYVRVVEDQPKDWNTANALGDLYMRAGQSAKAVPLYSRVANHLFAEGFYPRAAALFRKILKITPDDEQTQLRLAEISAQLGLLVDAKAYYATIEKRRRLQGDANGADEITVRLGVLDPEDLEARREAARALERRGKLPEAGQQYRELYEEFVKAKRETDASAALRDCVRCNPQERSSNLVPLARIELRSGRFDEARELLVELVSAGDDSRNAAIELASEFSEGSSEAGALCLEVAADALAASREFDKAAAALQQFARQVPSHVPTLLKLVEVCVDAGLDEMMFDAQTQLADAYLATGRAEEARVIAEDLVSRDPRDSAYVERLRRALQALNVEDVEASIAARISAADQDDAMPEEPGGSPHQPVGSRDHEPRAVPPAAVSSQNREAPAVTPKTVTAERAAPQQPPSMEIDLTGLLGELQGQATMPEPAARPSPELEEVFSEIRAEIDHDSGAGDTGDYFDLAKTYLDMGMRDEAIGSLQVAARSPRCRFAASAMIGEMYRDDGDLRAAIEWFERALEAPAPGDGQRRALLYDLGDLLETVGETARALAVFLELDADVRGFRDVSERVTRLSRVETEG